MLLANGSLLLDDPFAFFTLIAVVAVSLLIGITFHEAAHAYVARKLGDGTAARLGRITLNPRAHLDPAGTLMLLIAGFGWGKPVPVNPARLWRGRRGVAIVSAAGPGANVLVALTFAALFQVGVFEVGGFSRAELQTLDPGAWLNIIATYSVLLNVLLAAFNLLPLPPLDGGGVLGGIVPEEWLPAVAWLQRVGPVALIGIIALSIFTDLRPLGFLFDAVRTVADFLIG